MTDLPNLPKIPVTPTWQGTSNPAFRYIGWGVFLVIIFISIFYVSSAMLNINEKVIPEKNAENTMPPITEVSYYGKVVFTEPNQYPQQNISFVLVDKKGAEMILLKADDQKLQLAEGHYVTLYGMKAKTLDNKKDVLLVSRVVISASEAN